MGARAFFEAIARRYDREHALSGVVSRERLAAVVRELAGRRRVLALGLGTGRELPALLDAGHDVHGLELSPAMIALCNRRSRTVPITLGDLWAPLPFADASFDAALALHGTLAHPPDEGAFARLGRELARVLAPGGVLVAEVPAAAGLRRVEAASAGAMTVTSATTFVHRDAASGLELAGVALTAEGWAAAFGASLRARVEPLGEAEYRLVAARWTSEDPA